jgi:N-acetylneuraminate synthase
MTSSFCIDGRRVGPGEPVYLIAEMSANHQHSFDEAVKLVHAAADAGADAIKLQTYTADTLTIDSHQDCFRVGGGTLWDGRTLHDLYREAFTPWEWQPRLKEVAERRGLALFSSAFDPTAVAFLEAMDVAVHKVASFELVDLPLIETMARTGKPLILSTGMASETEIAEAVDAARRAGASQIVLLKCTSAYPSPPEEMHLRTIPWLAERFGVAVGLSDHTMGIEVPVAAVALGAVVIEKHFTLSRAVAGPDSAFSLEPHEFRAMVEAVRKVEKALGKVQVGGAGEQEARCRTFRRSLFVVKDISAGEVLTVEHVRSIRPGHGLAPKFLPDVLGRRVVRDLVRGTPLSWDVVEQGGRRAVA